MRIILIISFLFSIHQFWAQDKVEWTVLFNAEEGKIKFNAKLNDGWHIYSQYTDQNVGPVPTSFKIDADKFVRLKGKVVEPEPITAYDENFGGDVMYFEDEVSFEQNVKVKSEGVVKATVTFMLCNDEMCLPPVDELFEIEIKE